MGVSAGDTPGDLPLRPVAGRVRGVSDKYLDSYVAEFTYRYNRRSGPSELFGWVTRRLVQRPPQTLQAIRWAAEPAG